MPEEQQPDSAQNNTSNADGKNAGAQSGGSTQESKSQDEANQADKSFTQADLDKLAQRIRLEEKRKFEKQLKDAELTEQERTAKRVEELEKEIRLRDAREAVTEAARKAGAANAPAVYKLVRDMLEFDDKTGQVSNLREALEMARADAPEFFPKRPGSGNGGEGSGGSTSFSRNMNDLIRRSAGRQ
jgi:hypothetical protein